MTMTTKTMTPHSALLASALALCLASPVAAHAQATATPPAVGASHDHGSHADHAAPAAVDGEVRRIDAAAGKLTLRHGPIPTLDMAAMTMVFTVRDPALLQGLAVGDKVRFRAERIDGSVVVTELAPVR